ncbi:hypothetical protein QTN25_008347 [Entamoeba marina]
MSEDWGNDFTITPTDSTFILPEDIDTIEWGDEFSTPTAPQRKFTKIAVVDTDEDWGDFFIEDSDITTTASSSSISPSLTCLPQNSIKNLQDIIFGI